MGGMAGRGARRRRAGAAEGSEPKRRKAAAAASQEPAEGDDEADEGQGAGPPDFAELDGEEAEEEEEDDDDEEEEADEGEEEVEEEAAEEGVEQQPRRIWRPGIDEIQEGEQLDVEPGTYDMLHRAQVEWACLSFDILRDDLGAQRTTYPMTAYVVAGTQAKEAADNRVYMMKWSRLYKTIKDGREDDDEDDDDESDEESEDEHEAVLESKGAAHPGAVNRVRSMPQACHIVATWAETGKVLMWNLQSHRKALDRAGEKVVSNPKPIHTCEAHQGEGFAMDFSPHDTGRFLSGGNDGAIFLWEPVQGGWKVGDDSPFKGHSSSVEDVQWKRHGAGSQSVFASCSVDCSVRVWDTREKNRKKSAVHVPKAHSSDVNVLSWSPCVGELLVTGSDDGGFKIWDTRNVGAGPMANFLWHKKPITSVDWHPTDETVLAVASEDNSVSLWDMAVEDDRVGGEEEVPGESHFPAQLLFLHMGQTDPKELRWHPQLPSVCICTAANGFNIFKTCNI